MNINEGRDKNEMCLRRNNKRIDSDRLATIVLECRNP